MIEDTFGKCLKIVTNHYLDNFVDIIWKLIIDCCIYGI